MFEKLLLLSSLSLSLSLLLLLLLSLLLLLYLFILGAERFYLAGSAPSGCMEKNSAQKRRQILGLHSCFVFVNAQHAVMIADILGYDSVTATLFQPTRNDTCSSPRMKFV